MAIVISRVDGDITNTSYAADRLRDPAVLALMQKITVREDPAFAKPPRACAGDAPDRDTGR